MHASNILECWQEYIKITMHAVFAHELFMSFYLFCDIVSIIYTLYCLLQRLLALL